MKLKKTPSMRPLCRPGIRKAVVFLVTFLTMLAVLSASVSAKESELLKAPVYVDNQPVQTNYVMRDGHMMVPAMFFKHTGTEVNWNEKYDSIVFRLGGTRFANPTGTKYIDYQKAGTDQWERDTWATPSIHVDGQTFVPLVDVARRLGLRVEYDASAKRTTIQNPNKRTARRIGSGDSAGRQIALTFDDGPDATYTPQILDILKDKGVPATFFVVGRQVDQFPELMQRIVKEGHGLGNHSFTHPDLTAIQSSEVREELFKTQQSMSRAVNRLPDLFRPPYGKLTRADEDFLQEKGFRIVMWSVDTLDWTGLSGDEIFNRVKNNIKPGGIILQHNIDVNPGMLDGTVEALPRIIDELQKQGYTFVTVQTLLD
ncbi:polysaccharide deacetylase family protein [Salipaludibacillus aurantiacus]|uniref:Peptidoglycan/xylan/chitin deacetylase, PgdA/CDA1 family n=1 Tax=Salipaludibacillus aurantiacus TaxID=1601833 RepID=A0A1H9TG91_9BACI|nr:polysaccharide deacetylase family protein [Salipaludibacillus aurantiacus]SER96106.1 Peptidoglycan/xylan/chitin deacetylase, PgdA/CDA1 family [Salipaludibacillus aurantiacus]